jgi:hypothetical protein
VLAELDALPPVSPPLEVVLLVADAPPAPPVAEEGGVEHPTATNHAVIERLRIAVYFIIIVYSYHQGAALYR